MNTELEVQADYQAQLQTKIVLTKEEFAFLGVEDIDTYASTPTGFRMRAEFKIWHEGETAHYAMHAPGTKGKPYIISSFPNAYHTIQELMPKLLAKINTSQTLKRKLFQADFLTTTTQQNLVSLIYHRPLDEAWQEECTTLAEELGVSIIGRSKKQKVVLGSDHVIEQLKIDGKDYTYQQLENAFTQPNAYICEKMLAWAKRYSQNNNGDLLELYCGNGNFTIPLSENFNRVLATEISKPSIKSALQNCEYNKVDNITFVRMSSEEFTEALNGTRPFRRLKDVNLTSYNFSTVLVDPPRAGLDENTTQLIQRFDNIIYISCNPETLKRDLTTLNNTHKVEKMALFDQFPHTHHRECGAILKKNPNTHQKMCT